MVVAIGGRTGRDGIHGATFSSAELTSESESISGGAVQIGNAIEEKKVLDVLLAARDEGLYTAVTDCGAGGFSSAVGEMGEQIGAEVWLERAPLKYAGLSYTEIWISEAQERMVLSVPEQHVDRLVALCGSEDVEATVLGRFTPTGRLVLKYQGNVVADLAMDFLHDGRPPVVRQAEYVPPPVATEGSVPHSANDLADDLLAILRSLNVASKQWIIRQYDHEVQGGSVVKPLVGVHEAGPSDAAVLKPLPNSNRGVAISCGMNPHYGDIDPFHMAASAIDEAVRNCVAVGANPNRIALLDNFCWGDCEVAKTLGSLVRAAIACHDVAVALGTPFISGKDSLNNEFSFVDPSTGERRTIAIPPTLLISAMGQVDDVRRCVTMDFKQPGNAIYIVGETKPELGGSHWNLVRNASGGDVPTVDADRARETCVKLHAAIAQGTVRSCHDLSEGGLAVAVAEMCFAGGWGATIDIGSMLRTNASLDTVTACFSESNTRLLCEVAPDAADSFERHLVGVPLSRIGKVTDVQDLIITSADTTVIKTTVNALQHAWQQPLAW